MNKMSEDFGNYIDKFFDNGIKPYRRAIVYMDDVARDGITKSEHFDPYISEENKRLVNKRTDDLKKIEMQELNKYDSNLRGTIIAKDVDEGR